MIKIERVGNRLHVHSPFHPDFVARIKLLGGVWEPGAHVWSTSDQFFDEVRALLVEIYGEDGITPVNKVAVEVKLKPLSLRELWLLGRCLLIRRTKMNDVTVGRGVAVINGTFPKSGGSVKHPSIASIDNVLLRVLNVPETLLRELDNSMFVDSYMIIHKDNADVISVSVHGEALEQLRELMNESHLSAEEIVALLLEEYGAGPTGPTGPTGITGPTDTPYSGATGAVSNVWATSASFVQSISQAGLGTQYRHEIWTKSDQTDDMVVNVAGRDYFIPVYEIEEELFGEFD